MGRFLYKLIVRQNSCSRTWKLKLFLHWLIVTNFKAPSGFLQFYRKWRFTLSKRPLLYSSASGLINYNYSSTISWCVLFIFYLNFFLHISTTFRWINLATYSLLFRDIIQSKWSKCSCIQTVRNLNSRLKLHLISLRINLTNY